MDERRQHETLSPPCQPTNARAVTCRFFFFKSLGAISAMPSKHQKPSWGQAWRFRLQPFGRLSSRTKIVQITLKGSVRG